MRGVAVAIWEIDDALLKVGLLLIILVTQWQEHLLDEQQLYRESWKLIHNPQMWMLSCYQGEGRGLCYRKEVAGTMR